jgi:hypothetical protein
MADTQGHRDIARAIWDEFSPQLQGIGITQADLNQITDIPTNAGVDGSSAHSGNTTARATATQAISAPSRGAPTADPVDKI